MNPRYAFVSVRREPGLRGGMACQEWAEMVTGTPTRITCLANVTTNNENGNDATPGSWRSVVSVHSEERYGRKMGMLLPILAGYFADKSCSVTLHVGRA